MIVTANIKKIKSKLANPVVINIFWLSLDKSLKLVIGLIVGIWVARYLGPSQWGELNYVLAFVTIVTTIAKLGMDGFLIKEMLEYPSQKNEILGTSFFMRLVLIPFSLAAILLYFYLLDLDSTYYWILAFLAFNILVTPFDIIELDFQSRLQSKLTVMAKNIAYVLGAFVRVYLLVSGKPLLWFAAAMGLETFLAYIFLTFFYQRSSNLFHWTFSTKLIKKLLKVGWPYTLSSLAIILYIRADQVMLGAMVGDLELGLFSSVVKISDIFVFLPMAVTSSYLPSLINAKKLGMPDLLKSIQFFLNWMTRISLLIAIVVTVFADLIIQLLYGNQYLAAVPVLIIHIWSLVPLFLGVATTQYLIVQNLQKYSMYITLLGLTTNIILNVYLIPRHGAWGAAVATTMSQLVAAIVSVSLFRQTRILFYMQLKSFLMLFNFGR